MTASATHETAGEPSHDTASGRLRRSVRLRRLDDEVLAAAYEEVADTVKALIKRQIADVCKTLETSTPHSARVIESLGGLVVYERTLQPPQTVAVIIEPVVRSTSMIVAAALPAVMTGAPRISALFVEHGAEHAEGDERFSPAIPQETLVGLELSGVEEVSFCSLGAGSDAIEEQEAPAFDAAIVLGPGGEGRRIADAFGCAVVLEPMRGFAWPPKLGAWLDGDVGPDCDVIGCFYPEARLCAGGASDIIAGLDADKGIEPFAGDFQAFLELGCDALFLPRELMDQASGKAHVTLGAGRETSMLWPGLTPLCFCRRTVSLVDAIDAARIPNP